MSTLFNLLSNVVEKMLFHPVTITHAETIGAHFRRVSLQGEIFKRVKWVPGQAVQFYLGNMTKRAYTPMDIQPDAGSAEFLLYMHGQGPGSTCAENMKAGNGCKVMQPKNSLDFTNSKGNALFFGDETSIAAAYALQSCARIDARHRYAFEVTSSAQAKIVVEKLGLRDVTLYERTHKGEHLERAVREFARSATENSHINDNHVQIGKFRGQDSQWIFTGQASSIQRVQKGLRGSGVKAQGSKVRAYWSQGRTGLD